MPVPYAPVARMPSRTYAFALSSRCDDDAHESGTAQLEINFQNGDAVELSDQMFLFKRTIREAAMRHEIYATFMAKPSENEPGSSMHWHISLRRSDGTNALSNSLT